MLLSSRCHSITALVLQALPAGLQQPCNCRSQCGRVTVGGSQCGGWQDRETKFGRQPRPASAMSTSYVSTWQSLTNEHKRSTELARHVVKPNDQKRKAEVYVRPYSGRVTDYDMACGPQCKFGNAELDGERKKQINWLRDMDRLRRMGVCGRCALAADGNSVWAQMSVQLHAPCTCVGYKLRRLRCLEAADNRGTNHQCTNRGTSHQCTNRGTSHQCTN